MSDFENILALSGKRLSADQRAAVDSNVATVVSAGAGSGKTTVLSFRFLRLVSDGIDADRILTITFTKKAAAEMYERIHNLLSLASKENPRLEKQLKENFNKASISTMDSFWSEIARSGCIKYGITRDFSILSDEDSITLADKIVDSLAFDESIIEEYNYLTSNYKKDKVYSIFESIAKHIDILSEYSEDDIKKGLVDFISILKDELKSHEDLQGILNKIEAYRQYSTEKGFFANGDFASALEQFNAGNYSSMPKLDKRAKATNKDWAYVKSLVDLYSEQRKNIISIDLLEKGIDDEILLSRLLVVFARKFNSEKRKTGVLSFLDVQVLAKDILIKDRAIRDYYKNRFDYIMVDEFQDNNNEQKELLYLLSERKDRFTNGIPNATDIENHKLFFVGDDKQSIYRFRGADVSVFNSLKDEVVDKMGGVQLSLGDNYRSEKKLVEHFNAVFSNIFSKDLDSERSKEEKIVERFSSIPDGIFEASASDIRAGRTDGLIEPVIEFDVLRTDDEPSVDEDEDTEDSTLLSPTESEAEYIADRILEILDDSRFMIPDNGSLRKPRLDDICILYSKTKAQMPIERALRRRGISYTVVESSSATLEGLAYDIYSFLQLLVYPNDRKSYIEILLSPFARISNEGMSFLLDWDKNKEVVAFDETPDFKNPDDLESFNNAKKLYQSCLENVGRERLPKTLERLYYNSGYRTYLMGTSTLSIYDEHFSYLWSLATKIDSNGGNIVNFLDYIRNMIGKPEKLAGIDIQRLSKDGVKLMTIHKSKGLEFPIVILAGSGTIEKNQESQNSIVDTRHDNKPFLLFDIMNGQYLFDKGVSDSTPMPMAHYFNCYNQKRILAEKKRVLYVALTRAINHLVVTAVPHATEKSNGEPSSTTSLYKLYNEALMAIDYAGVDRREFDRYSESDTKNKHRVATTKRDMSWYDRAKVAREPIWHDTKTGVKENSHEEYDESSYYIGEELPDFTVEDILLRHPDIRPDFGTLVHSELEGIFSKKDILPYRNRNLSSLEEERLSISAKDIARNFISSDFFQRYISNGKKLLPEVRFFYPKDNLVLEGSADLVVIGDRYNLVVDYKTDKHKNPEVHKGQITMYARALEELYNKPCYGIVLYVRDYSYGPLWDKDGREVSKL